MARPALSGGVVTTLRKGVHRIELGVGSADDGTYKRHRETFHGTRTEARERLERLRTEYKLEYELSERGITRDDLAGVGLDLAKLAAGGRTADEVEEAYAAARRELIAPTVAEAVSAYLDAREALGKVRRSTLERDRYLARHVIEGLGGIRLAELDASSIEAFYVRSKQAGRSDAHVAKVHGLLRRVLRDAHRKQLIASNPLDMLDAPTAPRPQREFLDDGEARRLVGLITSGEPSAHKIAVLIGIATGARIGEVLGLTWSHLRESEGRPYFRFEQQHTQTDGTVGLMKTAASRRVVPIDSTTVQALAAWRKVQRDSLLELGIEAGADTPIVTNATGGHLDNNNLRRWLRAFFVEHGFGKLISDDDGRQIVTLTVGDPAAALYPEGAFLIEWRDPEGWPCDGTGRRYSRSYPQAKVKRHYEGPTFHSLRHTHFSIRLADGMDLATASKLGGWSSPNTLLRTYAHALPSAVWDSAGFLDDLTGGGKQNVFATFSPKNKVDG